MSNFDFIMTAEREALEFIAKQRPDLWGKCYPKRYENIPGGYHSPKVVIGYVDISSCRLTAKTETCTRKSGLSHTCAGRQTTPTSPILHTCQYETKQTGR